MSEEDFSSGGERFPPTRHSVIEAARSIDAAEREQALEALCAAYWKPIYKYVRWVEAPGRGGPGSHAGIFCGTSRTRAARQIRWAQEPAAVVPARLRGQLCHE